MSLKYGQLYFNGITKFLNNQFGEIISLSSSMLIFSNSTVFDNNLCIQLISMIDSPYYMVLLDAGNVTLSNNLVLDELIHVGIETNHPYPFCLFQYYNPLHNDSKDFQISILFNNAHPHSLSIYNSIHQLTSHCKWAPSAAFQSIAPTIVHRKIITLKYVYNQSLHSHHVGVHTTVCFSPSLLHYNCSIDQLGPVYPGENLTVDLCLPYNTEDIGILYVETYNKNLPMTACKIYDRDSMSHVFSSNQSRAVQFPIASEHPMCELFLTAQPNLFIYYDVFHVHFRPCPLGFSLQNGICDSDPDLREYIDDCMISDQSVRKFPNVYISATNSVSKHLSNRYVASFNCPTDYCLLGSSRVDLHTPDTQCQSHRTGLLCSKCEKGYSIIVGSSRCKLCTNMSLFYIISYLLSGLLLIIILFSLNITVTTGTANCIILYTNTIQINRSYLNLEKRLAKPLLFFISTLNLGPYFETCFYNGMTMYVKKWLQLTYPFYKLLIAILFTVGSRYSSKLYRLKFSKSLPVLATLFMVCYTSILLIVASALSYVTITHLPDRHSKIVWLHDPTLPLFGWKFLLFIVVCIFLSLFLLLFNGILLFSKQLMRYEVIYRFKPLIDAFQGPYKNGCYYWVGVQLSMRNLMVLLSLLGETVSFASSILIIVTLAIFHGIIQPYKNKWINYQELVLLYNYILLCVFLTFSSSEVLNVIMYNTMVGFSIIHFIMITIYHVFTYLSPCRRLIMAAVWIKAMSKCYQKKPPKGNNCTSAMMNIPEVDYHFASFREPLLDVN